MPKRTNFEKRPHNKYRTPFNAFLRLLPYLTPGARFIEPCAGDGRLVRWMEQAGLVCVDSFDIEPDDFFMRQADALTEPLVPTDLIVTNPSWDRPIMHAKIHRFRQHAPTWLLMDAGWSHTMQSSPFGPFCSHVVSVGRCKWIDGSKHGGIEDAAWYRFQPERCTTEFVWRTSMGL